MNRILYLMLPLAAASAFAGGVLAQNTGQIGKARSGADCVGCNLFQADFGGAQLKGRNYSRSRLRQADLSLTIMNRTSFAGADLRDVNGYGGVFSSANFARANMTNSTFVGAYLKGANFRGANLTGANLSGAEMQGAVVTQAQLNTACGDEATVLPRSLSIAPCR